MLKAFDLSHVRLLPGPIRDKQTLNTRYLLSLEPGRLLHTFRLQAGLPSNAEPLGGWEAPDCGLRGHFVGHYLSACAQGYAATGEVALRDRAILITDGLVECQNAIGTGYLSAFPESDLDTIETKYEGPWASYYTLHKILAGLLDVHHWCRYEPSLAAALQLGQYILERINKLSPEQLENMCRTDLKPNPTNEFGGLSEAFQNLATASGQDAFNNLAERFDRDWFVQPLIDGEDRLTALHANTHIAMVLGLARRYERTQDERFIQAVEYFWDRTAIARSYVNAGSSGPRPDGLEKSTGAEHWPEPFRLAKTLTPKINESCVTYNMMRLTDALFRWTADAKYAAFYERAYFNHVLAMQHPGYTGGYLYDHPLSPGSCKKFGHAHDAFWCCYGSSVEAFERLATGIYYHDDQSLWINQFVSSRVDWHEKGVRLEQRSDFGDGLTMALTINCEQPTNCSLNIRLPDWLKDITATLNGEVLGPYDPPYLSINRTWHNGDNVHIEALLHCHTETMPDDADMFAFLYGPFLLAARTDAELQVQADDANNALTNLVSAGPLTFRGRLTDERDVELIPINQIIDESFGVYFKLAWS